MLTYGGYVDKKWEKAEGRRQKGEDRRQKVKDR